MSIDLTHKTQKTQHFASPIHKKVFSTAIMDRTHKTQKTQHLQVQNHKMVFSVANGSNT